MAVEDSTLNGIQRALVKANRRGTILEGASDGLEFRPKTRRLEGGENFPLILFLAVGHRELFPPVGTTFRFSHKMYNLLNPLASPRRPVLSRKPDPDPSARVRSERRWGLDFARPAGYSDQSVIIIALKQMADQTL
jgi:hypothetical protein